ncbi:YfdX family protein [Fulvimarina sp. MAC3]|uniref:YfdX family protein n=1 Tax=Fulvimarina sp. MAC3 TaxID=3148887 RepID=UPI0031FE252A
MFKTAAIAIALAGATAFSPAAYAASSTAASQTSTQSMDQSASNSKADIQAARDFQKLSQDGFQAFRNIQTARLAIFDGKTDQAKSLVDKAVSQLKTAQTDGSTFDKAASQLKMPMNQGSQSMSNAKMDQSANGKSSDSTKTGSSNDTASNTNSSDQTKTWLPIDGQVMLGADYQVSDANAKALQDANKAMKNGDMKTANEQLKLAGVDVSFAVALVPLDQTMQDVQQAQSDLNAGKFYEANLDLKKVQDSIVIAEADAIGVPQSNDHAANASDSKNHSSAMNGQSAQKTAMSKTGDTQSRSSSTNN